VTPKRGGRKRKSTGGAEEEPPEKKKAWITLKFIETKIHFGFCFGNSEETKLLVSQHKRFNIIHRAKSLFLRRCIL
jgi:hypothetical protein